jgi:hypothetical protein
MRATVNLMNGKNVAAARMRDGLKTVWTQLCLVAA